MCWWFVSAHKWFKGPAVNVEHAMLRGEGAILHGVAVHDKDMDSGGDDQVGKEKGTKEAMSYGSPEITG